VASLQAPLKSSLAASGAENVQSFTVLNAISATVSSAEKSRLRPNPTVAEVVPDVPIHLAPLVTPTTPSGVQNLSRVAGRSSAVCAASGQVQLNPEALQVIHAASDDPSEPTASKLGIDGSGVTVGILADGLDINNPDFIRPNGQHVSVDYNDFTGAGTSAPTGGCVRSAGSERYGNGGG
jgi:hypothetical protein